MDYFIHKIYFLRSSTRFNQVRLWIETEIKNSWHLSPRETCSICDNIKERHFGCMWHGMENAIQVQQPLNSSFLNTHSKVRVRTLFHFIFHFVLFSLFRSYSFLFHSFICGSSSWLNTRFSWFFHFESIWHWMRKIKIMKRKKNGTYEHWI